MMSNMLFLINIKVSMIGTPLLSVFYVRHVSFGYHTDNKAIIIKRRRKNDGRSLMLVGAD